MKREEFVTVDELRQTVPIKAIETSGEAARVFHEACEDMERVLHDRILSPQRQSHAQGGAARAAMYEIRDALTSRRSPNHQP